MRWLFALVFCFLATNSFAESYAVVMDCEVTYQSVVSSEDGKPKTYAGFTGETEQGDTLRLEYGTSDYPELYMKLTDVKRDKNILEFDNASIAFLMSDKPEIEFGGDEKIVYFSSENGFLNMSPDKLNAKYFGQRLHLYRYYKSDFHGLRTITNAPNLTTLVQTFDCRMVKDEIEQILAKVVAKLDSD